MTLDRNLVMAALPAYDIEGELGRGGWGIVLAGRHRQLGRDVAIKQLPRALAADPAVRARFLAEARVLASLDHPHIVPIYDFVEHEGLCLLVMERLAGGTVWSRFTGNGLTMDAACAVLLAACDALHCAHNQRVLHRDIKPENLLFTAGNVVKVADFGIAKVIGGPKTLATRAGEVLGTPAYMAPEQAQAAELTPATDVYAAGTVLYELLSGRLPFEEDGDALALLYRHVYEPPVPLSDVAPNVPQPIADVVMRAITTDPKARFPSAEAFGCALAEAAKTAWEPGWLARGEVRVIATSSIVGAIERPSGPMADDVAPPVATEAPQRPAPPTEVEEPVPASAATPPSPPPRVRPTTTTSLHSARPAIGEDEELALVPVHEVLRPPAPTVYILTALALLILTVAIAFVGGSPDYARTPGLSVTVNGVDAGSGRGVELDLEQPVEIAGALPGAPSPPSEILLHFAVVGIPLGSASAAAQAGPDQSFTASIDAGGARYLVGGEVTGEVELRDGSGATVGSGSMPVTSRQPAFLTLPGAAATALLLFVIAYAGSLLRSRRRGRKAVTATAGMAIIGAVGGVATVIVAWLAAGRQPVATTVVVCALLGAGAGLAAALAAGRMSRRRRRRNR